jgi:hypothetical protein
MFPTKPKNKVTVDVLFLRRLTGSFHLLVPFR